MTDDKPEMTPREKIAKLAAMTDAEFNQFMHWNFNRICKEPLPESSVLPPANEDVSSPGEPQ